MNTLTLEENLNVFGIEVKSFPAGISEAFDTLIQQTGDGAGERNYYGVVNMNDDGRMIYKAVAEEKYEGEAERFNYKKDTIEKGLYLCETLYHWNNKTNLIKDIFCEMMYDERADKTKPAVEWYKTNDEMLCMIKAK